MKLIVTGATGTSGREVVSLALQDSGIEQVTVIVRRPLEFVHPKLKVVIHEDFLNYSGLEQLFVEATACAWCLGISQMQVSVEDLEKITYSYALAAANAMLAANPNIAFLFQSGGGADRTETGSTAFARIKGKTENALLQLPFKKLYITRPGGIQGVHLNKNAPLVYKLINPLYPLIKLFAPNLVISSVELAKASLALLKNGADHNTFGNKELKQISLSYKP